ncbi:RING-type domain-containing protein [Meloidogyne graminicola]|uniref:RING-type domain-containing protein n=1 Tax=Meloidogyne graminicola TaxID=189291 RepID=A0A8S9ZRL9_9BILA|nr:RING-type domain-containing protein [Meloidogyne graminicola]
MVFLQPLCVVQLIFGIIPSMVLNSLCFCLLLENIIQHQCPLQNVKGRHITLDSKYYRMLEKQSICLVNFLVKKFGTDNIIGYETHKELNEETVVDNHFKINYNGNNYIYRFNQEFNFSTHHYYYYEGSPEYNDLYNCNQIIEEAIPQYEVDNRRRRFINLNKLYKRFNSKQLYFNYIPIFEEDQILQVNQDLIENNKEGCSVCLSDFLIGDYVIMTSCEHIFHINCLHTCIYSTLIVYILGKFTNKELKVYCYVYKGLVNNSTCPICRRQIHLTQN